MKTNLAPTTGPASSFVSRVRPIFSALLLLAPQAQSAGLDYFRVTNLGSLQFSLLPGSSRGLYINDNGQVAGKISGPVSDQAAIWQNGTATGLGYWTTSATFSEAHAINGAGDVAVYGNDPFGLYFAYVRKAGGTKVSALLPNGYNWASPTGIDSGGRMTGWAKMPSYLYGRAFYALMDGNTRPTLLPSLSIDSFSMATCMNDNGTLMGGYSFNNPNSPSAMIWNPQGAWQRVGTLFMSSVEDINNSGIAVGFDGSTAVAFDSSGTVVLTAGVACAINNSNYIVGNTVRSVTASDSLAWLKVPAATTPYSLTALQTSSRILYTALDINSRLQIVGQSSTGLYMAKPVAIRSSGGAWSTSSAWQWGLVPDATTPVALSGASAITIAGPASATTVAELTVGNNVRLELAAGQTMTLQAGSFGSGTTTISQGGTLVLNGQLTSPVTVAGMLTGAAAVNGPVTVQSGGVVAPGNSPGAVSVSGNFQMAAGAIAAMELNGLTAGMQHDQIQVSGTVNLGGAILALAVGAGFTLTPGQSFTLINNQGPGAVGGAFASLPEGALLRNFMGAGVNATITYTGGTGNDVVLGILARSSNAALATLGTTSPGSLSPAFTPNHLGYTLTVAASAASITFQTETADPFATVRINGQAPGTAFNLNAGPTPFDVVVTAENGITTRMYHVDVTRLAGTYEDWQILKFGANATNPAIAGDDMRPGGDTLANLVKYYSGLEPLANESDAQPKPSHEPGYVCLTYRRKKGVTDAVGQAKWSTDLEHWSTVGVIEEEVPELETDTSLMVKAKVPVGSQENAKFMRLEVTRSP